MFTKIPQPKILSSIKFFCKDLSSRDWTGNKPLNRALEILHSCIDPQNPTKPFYCRRSLLSKLYGCCPSHATRLTRQLHDAGWIVKETQNIAGKNQTTYTMTQKALDSFKNSSMILHGDINTTLVNQCSHQTIINLSELDPGSCAKMPLLPDLNDLLDFNMYVPTECTNIVKTGGKKKKAKAWSIDDQEIYALSGVLADELRHKIKGYYPIGKASKMLNKYLRQGIDADKLIRIIDKMKNNNKYKSIPAMMEYGINNYDKLVMNC